MENKRRFIMDWMKNRKVSYETAEKIYYYILIKRKAKKS